MRTVTFKSIMHRALQKVGLDPAGTIPDGTWRALGEYIDEHVRAGWESFAWPEMSPTEERSLRPEYDALVANEINDEVHYTITDQFYRCIAANTGIAPENLLYWEPLTKVDPYFELEQRGQTPIGIVLGIYDCDPQVNKTTPPLRTTDAGDRVWLPCYRSTFWVWFRLAPPQFSYGPVVGATTYAAGDVVYNPADGECYLALVAALGSELANDEKWERQPVPLVLRDFAALKAAASLQGEDGRDAKAAKLETAATTALETEQNKFLFVTAGAERR